MILKIPINCCPKFLSWGLTTLLSSAEDLRVFSCVPIIVFIIIPIVFQFIVEYKTSKLFWTLRMLSSFGYYYLFVVYVFSVVVNNWSLVWSSSEALRPGVRPSDPYCRHFFGFLALSQNMNKNQSFKGFKGLKTNIHEIPLN